MRTQPSASVDTPIADAVGTGTIRISPMAVGGLAFVTAVVTGFAVVVIGNDLGPILNDATADRADVWRPLLIFLCLPIATIVGMSALATVTGTRHPASALACGAVTLGTFVGTGSGRIVWRYIELQTYDEIRGLLDPTAVVLLASSAVVGGVVGALVGDRFRNSVHAPRISELSIVVATALLAYPTMELIGGRPELGSQQLWMLGFMMLALGLAPRIGLLVAEGEDADLQLSRSEFYDIHAQRDNSAASRLTVGFAAGWMASLLVNVSQNPFDGQLGRYVMAWILPALLAAPGILAHLDRLTGRTAPLEPAPVESFSRESR